MAIHEEILLAARRLCADRRSWTFSPAEVVSALPHLNERSVRTHVVSRCCVNAPSHHPHRWPYFERIGRGKYRIRAEYRVAGKGQGGRAVASEAAEASPAYAVASIAPRDSVHAVLSESEGQYVAECLEVAVVTQGRSLDETLANLRDALRLYTDGEDPEALGLVHNPRVLVTFETVVGSSQCPG